MMTDVSGKSSYLRIKIGRHHIYSTRYTVSRSSGFLSRCSACADHLLKVPEVTFKKQK